MQKTKSVVVNKAGKVEVHMSDNQSWNSCHKVASDHELTFGSAIEPKKDKALCALTMHYSWPLTSAKTWCLCGPDAQVSTSVFCTEPRLGFCW